MEEKVTVRYTAPTRYDKAAWGSICKVMSDSDEFSYYIQITKNEDHAHWVKVEDFLSNVFYEYIENQNFILACLDYITGTDKERSFNLGRIIQVLLSEQNKESL